MVTIMISKDRIKATGHADYAEHGKDIICASVSILLQALEVGINKRFLEVVKKEPGDLEYKIHEPAHQVQAIYLISNLKMIIDTLKTLANENPEYVEVIEV